MISDGIVTIASVELCEWSVRIARRLHLLIRILDTCITVASKFTCGSALGDSHTRWGCIDRGTQCPRVTRVCITCEEAPANRTRIGSWSRIYNAASVDAEPVSISANLRRVAGAWH